MRIHPGGLPTFLLAARYSDRMRYLVEYQPSARPSRRDRGSRLLWVIGDHRVPLEAFTVLPWMLANRRPSRGLAMAMAEDTRLSRVESGLAHRSFLTVLAGVRDASLRRVSLHRIRERFPWQHNDNA